ncbi:DNA-binding domain-containing protein [Caballeronia sp. LjRoot34]|uniref:HvfC/BufC N-terminal domain-containing protein n=1 Tax=Caballeronia sp. LjRoot34 TaxID=3342325 RepID=UPI003ED0667C
MAREKTLQVSARPLDGRAGLNADCLCERQRNFAAAILDPNMPVPRGLIGPDREPSEKRFNVYRNNVVAGLVEALKAAYPAVCRIVGHDFFAAMARVYVALEPPRSPVMLDYGETFPDFIERFEPAKSVPYLRDVARLERAWVDAYHAAEAPPADPALLATIDSRSLPQIGFMLHPTVRVVRSSFPVVQIWLMNIDAGEPAAIDISSGGENALVVRPIAEVEVRRLPAGAATFVIGLAAGASVADATALAFDEDGDFDLAGALQDLFAINMIVGWNVREGSEFSPIARVA